MESAEKRIRASGSSSRRYCRTQELTVRSANTGDIEAWLSLWRGYFAALDGPTPRSYGGNLVAHSRAGRADLVPSRLSQRGEPIGRGIAVRSCLVEKARMINAGDAETDLTAQDSQWI